MVLEENLCPNYWAKKTLKALFFAKSAVKSSKKSNMQVYHRELEHSSLITFYFKFVSLIAYNAGCDISVILGYIL